MLRGTFLLRSTKFFFTRKGATFFHTRTLRRRKECSPPSSSSSQGSLSPKSKTLFFLFLSPESVYKGGEFYVSKGDGEELCQLGNETGMAAFECHYVTHFADLEHRIEKLTSGYRLALVYNLLWTKKTTIQSLSSREENEKEVKRVLEDWKVAIGFDAPEMVAYPLSHEYTEASISELGVDCLKGRDYLVASFLSRANDVCPLGLSIAIVETYKSGDEYVMDDVHFHATSFFFVFAHPFFN